MCDADGKEWKEKKKLKRLTKMPSFVLLSLKVEELIKHLEIEIMKNIHFKKNYQTERSQ